VFVAVFLAPALLLFTVFVAIPGARALAFSLRRWNGFSEPVWVGLDNFQRLFGESSMFLPALGHNLFLMAVPGALILGLALFFAAMLHRRVRGAALFRAAFFFPNVIASVAVALLWTLLYSATAFGVLNGLLAAIESGLGVFGLSLGLDPPVPFTDSKYVLFALVPMLVWMMTGFFMVLFLAAMEGIPESFYEVARLEGASPWAQFRLVTLPLIREVFAVGVVFLCIFSLKLFDVVWVMENQTPSRESHVMATLVYQKVFSDYQIGYGASVAVMLFLCVFAVTLLALRLRRREGLEF
jgi:ABC-type sugar transport system permease subunit